VIRVRTVEQILTKVRTLLILDHPFYGALALRLKPIEDKDIGTCCTNGEHLRYNPEWISNISSQELIGVMAHEVTHIANGHVWRLGERNIQLWNIACDYTINDLLKRSGFQLPKEALLNQSFTDMAAEEIYSKLERKAEQEKKDAEKQQQDSSKQEENDSESQGGSDGNSDEGENESEEENEDGSESDEKESEVDSKQEPKDCGGCGSIEAAPEDKQKELEVDWKIAVSQAAQLARNAGQMSEALERMVKEFIDPTLPWNVFLRDFVEKTAKNDYSWSKPNRRYLSHDIILPGIVSEEIPTVVYAIDTSGSISAEQLDKATAEVFGVLSAYDTTVYVVFSDSAVRKTMILTRQDLPIKLDAIGGGGTDFGPVFQWVEEQGISPSCLIYLTDMEGYFPKRTKLSSALNK